MRWLLVTSLVASSSSFATTVLVVPENDKAREVAGELVEPFAKSKVKVKLAGAQAPAALCLNRPPGERPRCLAQAGQTAFVEGLIQLGASAKNGRTSITFQVLSLDDGRLLKREVSTGPSGNLGGALRPVVARLAKLFGASRTEPKPAPVATKPNQSPPKQEPVEKSPESTVEAPVESPAKVDAPKKDGAPTKAVSLTPSAPEKPPEVVVPTEPSGALTAVAWTTTSVAVAAAAAAGIFGGLGLNAKNTVEKSDNGFSDLSRSQANALAGQANLDFTVALASAIGAGALGLLSAIFWSQTP